MLDREKHDVIGERSCLFPNGPKYPSDRQLRDIDLSSCCKPAHTTPGRFWMA